MGYIVDAAGELARASPCACQAQCQACGGERFVIREEGGYSVAAPCACVSLIERVTLFNEARVPAGYATKSIQDFIHKPDDRTLARAKQAFMRYIKAKDLLHARGAVLAGSPGVGKTHLVCGLINYLTLQRGVACRFVDFFELTNQIRATFAGKTGESEASLIEPLVTVPVLVIDDLGKGRGSNWELTIVDQLITRRYNAGRVVMATTNYFPERGAAGRRPPDTGRAVRESLDERIGDRLMSRLVEMADVMVLEGEDRRRMRSAPGGPGRR